MLCNIAPETQGVKQRDDKQTDEWDRDERAHGRFALCSICARFGANLRAESSVQHGRCEQSPVARTHGEINLQPVLGCSRPHGGT